MFDSNPPAPDAIARFYDNYLNCLHKASIPEKQRRWYVKRIEEFIKTHSGCKIKSLSDQEVSRYLEMIGRKNRLSGWQFAQCIDAIRILYCELLSTPACQGLDWEYRQDSARQLDNSHPMPVASTNGWAATRYAIALQLTCWKRTMISAQCRNCSDMPMFPRP